MTSIDRIFAVSSDEALIQLISSAQNRLVVIAPALTKAVAEAVSRRFDDLGQLGVTVILDSDPEVYRLGFGDQEALESIREASSNSMFDLREQSGVRIGVVISDDTTMVFSPISKNIEAGSISVEKPNAIILASGAGDSISTAAGADMSENAPKPELGTEALDPEKVQKMQSSLKANPPKPFDIARKMNIFSSKVQYVEFSASNYRLAKRQIPLPAALINVADNNLKDSITSRIQAPFDGIGKLDIIIGEGEETETIKVDDEWLKKERKRIEDEYTFQINNFGRVILYNDRQKFDKATERFKVIVTKYQTAMGGELKKSQSIFEERIIEEFAPKWKDNPPKHFSRWSIEATPENIRNELQRLAQEIFESAISFDEPKVKILYKNVAPENLQNTMFLEVLERIMVKRRVPREIVNSLFETGQAAPETGAFLHE
jgi:hypothetical protein